MAYNEREENILKLLRGKQSVSNHELAKSLYVSIATLRRDLDKMERKGLVTRLHGATAIRFRSAEESVPLELREQIASSEKQRIAKKAVAYVKNGDVIMMDASTTAASLVPYLSQFQDIIVITNGAKTAYLLGHAGIQTISTGGRMIIESQALIGRDALETLQNYNADVCFFSCRALSPNGDFTDNSAELCEVRRKMMKQSRVKIFLCDSTKFNKSALVNFGNLSDADAVITDSALPESYNEYLRK